MRQDTRRTPFADGAPILQRSDWGDPVVLKTDSKEPLLKGFTGYKGVSPTDEQVEQWIEQYAANYVGLRPAVDMALFDEDHHSGKTGADTWQRFQDTHGEQEPTWSVTARGHDSLSRTLLYRLPEGTDTKPWRDALMLPFGGGIDLIRRWHRTQVFPPSGHHTGGTYVLYDPDGEPFTGYTLPPKNEALPLLSDEAIMHMNKECVCFYVPRRVRIKRERRARQISRMPRTAKRRGALSLLRARANRLAGMEPETYRNGVLNNGYYLFLNQVHGEQSLSEGEVWNLLYDAGIAADLPETEVVKTLTSARDNACEDARRSARTEVTA